MSIRQQLHAISPYEGFEPVSAPDNQGWNSTAPIFQQLIEEIRPKLVIEVGSWKGGSAINMAGHLKRLDLSSELVCVDTWLGAMEFWTPKDSERYDGLRLRHGYPSVYYVFLSNVVHAGFQDIITPFPLSSVTAALWFHKHNVKADLIYIDASHEEEDVHADLEAYWPVLREGGVMFGDDFVISWPGVIRATEQFSEAKGLQLEEHDGFWVMRKPADSGVTPTASSLKAVMNVAIMQFRLDVTEAVLKSMSSEAVPRETFFNIGSIYKISLDKAVAHAPGEHFVLHSSSCCMLHPPVPPSTNTLDIVNVEWGTYERFFAMISVPNANAPDVEFIAQIKSPDDTMLLQESIRISPLAIMGWHFPLPKNIPAGSLLSLGTRVAWAATNDYAWATWSNPMLFS